MALDSVNKRQSCTNIISHMYLGLQADGAIDADDRANISMVYGGLWSSGGGSTPTTAEYLQAILAIVNGNRERLIRVESESLDTREKVKNLYSAIRDMRRELLRGNKPGRKDLRR